jgi:hypothetical protein
MILSTIGFGIGDYALGAGAISSAAMIARGSVRAVGRVCHCDVRGATLELLGGVALAPHTSLRPWAARLSPAPCPSLASLLPRTICPCRLLRSTMAVLLRSQGWAGARPVRAQQAYSSSGRPGPAWRLTTCRSMRYAVDGQARGSASKNEQVALFFNPWMLRKVGNPCLKHGVRDTSRGSYRSGFLYCKFAGQLARNMMS